MPPLDFIQHCDPSTNEQWIETSLSGKPLLTTPQLNKGSAFTPEERREFGLLGKLPPEIETLDQQVTRAYEQFLDYSADFQRHIYLNNLHDTNHVLFYKLVLDHLEEMMPLIYTPHVGTAVKTFSHQFRRARGLYISYPNLNEIDTILENRSNPNIELVVVTDGEAVLGIGDQGVGAINIPIAKLMVYTLCAGINPTITLPIMLDVGTDNEHLLNDPLYLGWKHKRLRGKDYEGFIKKFIHSIQKHFPNCLLHWEDFAAPQARQNLAASKNKICSFNDDIQGTGAVAVATILAAVKSLKQKLIDQRIVIFGAGTAGVGVADQLVDAMLLQDLSLDQARARIWLVDRPGLLTTEISTLKDFQIPYAKNPQEIQFKKNAQGIIDLLETIKQVKPNILIGSSSVMGAFTQEIIQTMAGLTPRPIIMPLSNPTTNSEADPSDIWQWTQGQALIATGSPFPDITYQGRTIAFAQCNNAFIFPGIGLGVIAAQAKAITPAMLVVASEALSAHAPVLLDPTQALLPKISQTRKVAYDIALALATQAIKEGLSSLTIEEVKEKIDKLIWYPKYLPLHKS